MMVPIGHYPDPPGQIDTGKAVTVQCFPGLSPDEIILLPFFCYSDPAGNPLNPDTQGKRLSGPGIHMDYGCLRGIGKENLSPVNASPRLKGYFRPCLL